MMFTTLISTEQLEQYLGDPGWAIADCRFDLVKVEWGEAQYRAGHIPGAVYAHLDRDLSGPKTGRNGRHPLPDLDEFQRRLGAWGIGAGVQVVAYDQDTGMYASRLWWLLRYLGHMAVAVLDGGFAKWQREGREVQAGDPTPRRAATAFTGVPQAGMLVTAEEVEQLRQDPRHRVIDARAPARYRGEVEPLDPVAGHIPGAVNYYNLDNLSPDRTYLPREALRERLIARLEGVAPENVVSYCGSGVAAAQNILALEHAGLTGAKLYAGSWSEWCADAARPVATDA